ncbi:hypothetical protein WMW72_09515 [Paenibacillus filicis]|uniref:Uncharacterized protein n=1 Tax=Paenibacillus filicis TaxID=669464 RepID=A0ABU9DGZ2_9BACL
MNANCFYYQRGTYPVDPSVLEECGQPSPGGHGDYGIRSIGGVW